MASEPSKDHNGALDVSTPTADTVDEENAMTTNEATNEASDEERKREKQEVDYIESLKSQISAVKSEIQAKKDPEVDYLESLKSQISAMKSEIQGEKDSEAARDDQQAQPQPQPDLQKPDYSTDSSDGSEDAEQTADTTPWYQQRMSQAIAAVSFKSKTKGRSELSEKLVDEECGPATEADDGDATPWYQERMAQMTGALSITKDCSDYQGEKMVDENDDPAKPSPLEAKFWRGLVDSAKQSVRADPLKYAAFATAAIFLIGFGLFLHRYFVHDTPYFVNWNRSLNVAFIGNEYLYANDIPRVMEAISEGHIHQESVIHASKGSIPALLMRGNGMYGTWNTENAYVDTVQYDGEEQQSIYDYGLCTVGQILEGYDEILSFGNEDNAYYDDGLNPCIQDEAYFYYTSNEVAESNNKWDYVVLADDTMRMATSTDSRQDSIYALAYAYAPMIAKGNAIPVIVDTHSYWANDNDDGTSYGDPVEFQSMIYAGVYEYQEALANALPSSQRPMVAPVGIAYLTVYEERPDTWEKLFSDGVHASVHGSYLFACVLYSTLYGHLPQKHNEEVESLFASARQLADNGDGVSYPDAHDAAYLRHVARRVVLRGYIPRDLQSKLQDVKDSLAAYKAELAAYEAAQAEAEAERENEHEEEREHEGEDHGEEGGEDGPDE
mmetsp:Transcript_20743/g.44908  ORF Transcript_20743/g.44908 Transcript_20743/m.44908 type:complete len:668 (+) Transcript_20743:130-2133(+)